MILKEELGNRNKPFQWLFVNPKAKIMSFKVSLPLSTPPYPFSFPGEAKNGKLVFFVSLFLFFICFVSRFVDPEYNLVVNTRILFCTRSFLDLDDKKLLVYFYC